MAEGARILADKLIHFRPQMICFNGKGVFIPFVAHFNEALAKQTSKTMKFGRQAVRIPSLEDTILFCVPSTSGRVAHYQRDEKKTLFVELKRIYDTMG